MDAAQFEVYRSRGEELADAMKFFSRDVENFPSTVALLAVHSAISYNDALLILLTGKRPRTENHREAISRTRSACGQSRLDPTGVSQLERLLSAKTDISYGSRAVRPDKAEALLYTAQRFQAWAIQSIAENRKRKSQ
jgi:hypothetical protein